MLEGQPGYIRVEGVSKRYFRRGPLGLLRSLVRTPGPEEELWALKKVSFQVGPGEAYGIIGKNGSGKSTMLKVLAGILRPTEGKVSLQGRLTCLIEVGAGFHPELTGRENIYLHGAISGMSRQEIRQRLDSIIDYAELAEFIDLPVKNYSSGMYTRLGFSVAVHSHPGILLVDEVLSVGDQAFQAKCLQTIRSLMESGTAVILVSHNLFTVTGLCGRGLWLSRGLTQQEGEIQQVARAYDRAGTPENQAQESMDSGSVLQVRKVQINQDPADLPVLPSGDPIVVELELQNRMILERPTLCCAILDQHANPICASNTRIDPCGIERLQGSQRLKLSLLPPRLLPGRYFLSLQVCDEWQSTALWQSNFRFEIESPHVNLSPKHYGNFLVENRWELVGEEGVSPESQL